MFRFLFVLLLLPSAVFAQDLSVATTQQILTKLLNADAAKLDTLRIAFGVKLNTVTTTYDSIWDGPSPTPTIWDSTVVKGLQTYWYKNGIEYRLSHIGVESIPRKASYAEILQYLKDVVIEYKKNLRDSKADSLGKITVEAEKSKITPTF